LSLFLIPHLEIDIVQNILSNINDFSKFWTSNALHWRDIDKYKAQVDIDNILRTFNEDVLKEILLREDLPAHSWNNIRYDIFSGNFKYDSLYSYSMAHQPMGLKELKVIKCNFEISFEYLYENFWLIKSSKPRLYFYALLLDLAITIKEGELYEKLEFSDTESLYSIMDALKNLMQIKFQSLHGKEKEEQLSELCIYSFIRDIFPYTDNFNPKNYILKFDRRWKTKKEFDAGRDILEEEVKYLREMENTISAFCFAIENAELFTSGSLPYFNFDSYKILEKNEEEFFSNIIAENELYVSEYNNYIKNCFKGYSAYFDIRGYDILNWREKDANH